MRTNDLVIGPRRRDDTAFSVRRSFSTISLQRLKLPLFTLLVNLSTGSAQDIPCSTGLWCYDFAVTVVNSVHECCVSYGRTYRPSIDAEICITCYCESILSTMEYWLWTAIFPHGAVYGWVQNIAADLTSAEPQEDIPLALEGQEIALNIYFVANYPVYEGAFLFTIESSGTAVGML